VSLPEALAPRRRRILALAAAASVLPLAWSILVPSGAAAEVRTWTAFLLAGAFAVGIALAKGSRLADSARESERPKAAVGFVAWWREGVITVISVAVISIILLAPAFVLNGFRFTESWSLILRILAVALFGFPLAHGYRVVIDAGTPEGHLVGVVAVAILLFAIWRKLGRAPNAFRFGSSVLTVCLAAGVTAASAVAHSFRSAGSRAAHRRFAGTLWAVIGGSCLYLWVFQAAVLHSFRSAAPRDLLAIDMLTVAPQGPWVVLAGPTASSRRWDTRDPLFLLDTETGRFRSLSDLDAWSCSFNRRGTEAICMTLPEPQYIRIQLDKPHARPSRSDFPCPIRSPDDRLCVTTGWRAGRPEQVVSVRDAVSGRRISSVRLPSPFGIKVTFPSANRLRLFVLHRTGVFASDGPSTRSYEILDYDVDRATLRPIGLTPAVTGDWADIYSSLDGERLILDAAYEGSALLLDGAGNVIAPLIADKRRFGRRVAFLSDGGIVVVHADPLESRLEILDRDARLQRSVSLGAAGSISFAGEIRKGWATVAVSNSAFPGRFGQVRFIDIRTGEVRIVPGAHAPAALIPDAYRGDSEPWPVAGSDGARIFVGRWGTLERIDPEEGERTLFAPDSSADQRTSPPQ
jgi:hypothetical protein